MKETSAVHPEHITIHFKSSGKNKIIIKCEVLRKKSHLNYFTNHAVKMHNQLKFVCRIQKTVLF